MFENRKIIFNSLLIFLVGLSYLVCDCASLEGIPMTDKESLESGSNVKTDPKSKVLDPYEGVEFDTETLIDSTLTYTSTKHKITTEDGKELTFFRIIPTTKSSTETKKPVALLMHGAMGSSSHYVFAGLENSLGYHLMAKGFDVWLGNFRGNMYGGLETKSGPWWDFSFDEMGEYDLPAHIDYILKETNQDKLTYIGFSMGTTAGYIMLSKKPEYNDKIDKMISMAPVAFITTSQSSIMKRIVMGLVDASSKLGKFIRADRLLYLNQPFILSDKPRCYENSIRLSMCKQRIKGDCADEGHPLYDQTIRDLFFHIQPVGVSWKTIAHYVQMSQKSTFEPFVYYESENMKRYNKKKPDPYDLSKIRVPLFLLLGRKDNFGSEQNIEKLRKGLTNCKPVTEFVNHEDFNHLDFFLAKGLKSLVFEPITDFLEGKSKPKENS